MMIDLSIIPSVCSWIIWSSDDCFWCRLEETVRGRKISSSGKGDTPQEAVNNAVKEFTK